MSNADAERRIIIALDVRNREAAYDLAARLPGAQVFKVGLELFTAEGPGIFKKFKALRKAIFLDLKLHDIPNTVAGAVASGMRHGVRMMTLHASGGREMMAAAARRSREVAETEGLPRPLLLGVTVLTSLKGPDLGEVGWSADAADQVRRLAGLAKTAGLDGVVCSPQEIDLLRREFGPELVIVTPGIRPVWAAAQDQKRIMTPAEALAKGADYLVIGRPVTGAPEPGEAFARVAAEISQIPR